MIESAAYLEVDELKKREQEMSLFLSMFALDS